MLDIRKIICELQSLLSGVENHEHLLMKEIGVLRDKIEIYLYDETSALNEVTKQFKIINTFIDIYLWSLWNYIQTLHKEKSREKRQKKFENELLDNYKRAKDLKDVPEFFTKYSEDDLRSDYESKK